MEAALAADVVKDAYVVGAAIGRGAFSCLFVAEDRRRDETVVLKVTDTREKTHEIICEREAIILTNLAHPNVVELYARHAKVAGRYDVAALEYLRGPTLDAVGEAIGALREGFVRSVAMDLCGALRYLHAHGVLHRDLKPDNVVLVGLDATRPSDGENPERAVLIDFGLARTLSPADVDLDSSRHALDDSLSKFTMDLSAVGCRDYAAPEVTRGYRGGRKAFEEALAPCTSKYGVAADVYSFGRVLRHAFCGTLESEAPPLAALCGVLSRAMTKSRRRVIWSLRKAASESARDAVNGLTRRDAAARMKLSEFEAHPWLNAGRAPVLLASPKARAAELLDCAMDLSARRRSANRAAAEMKRSPSSTLKKSPSFAPTEAAIAEDDREDATPEPSPAAESRTL